MLEKTISYSPLTPMPLDFIHDELSPKAPVPFHTLATSLCLLVERVRIGTEVGGRCHNQASSHWVCDVACAGSGEINGLSSYSAGGISVQKSGLLLCSIFG